MPLVRKPLIFKVILMLFLSQFSAMASAKDVFLSAIQPDYHSKLESLRPGDIVSINEFGRKFYFFGPWVVKKTHQFKIGERLGSGGWAVVFALQDDPTKVLRLMTGQIQNYAPNIDNYGDRAAGQMKRMMNGYKLLLRNGVPVTKIHSNLRQGANFLIVDRADGPTLFKFLSEQDKFSETERTEMRNALFTFARASAAFSRIGDFNSSNIVFSKLDRRWKLFDWDDSHVLASGVYASSVWTQSERDPYYADFPVMREGIISLYKELHQEVIRERARLKMKDCEYYLEAEHAPKKTGA